MRCCAGLTLTCRAGSVQVPSRPLCSSGRDGGIAAVGHSRCRHPSAFEEQWTQPFGAWHGGHSLWSLACSPCPVIYHQRFVEPGADGHLWGICPCWTCVELSTACPMQKCMGSVVGADCIPRHTCRCRQQKTCSGSTQPSGACQVHMLSPFSALHQVSTAKQALTLQCFAADAASAAVVVATTCF